MLFPTQSLDALLRDPDQKEHIINKSTRHIYAQLCSAPSASLNLMHDPSLSAITAAPAKAFLQEFLSRVQKIPFSPPSDTIASRTRPRLVQYGPNPLRLLAWRIDRPTRMILYTGAACPPPSKLDTTVMQPHTFQKILLEERTRRPQPSVIQFLSPEQNSNPHAAVRASLAAYAKHRLTPFFERVSVPRAQQQPRSTRTTTTATTTIPAASHILEEVVACFIHPPSKPENHTAVPINGAAPWNKAHIDPRSVRVCVCVYGRASAYQDITTTTHGDLLFIIIIIIITQPSWHAFVAS